MTIRYFIVLLTVLFAFDDVQAQSGRMKIGRSLERSTVPHAIIRTNEQGVQQYQSIKDLISPNSNNNITIDAQDKLFVTTPYEISVQTPPKPTSNKPVLWYNPETGELAVWALESWNVVGGQQFKTSNIDTFSLASQYSLNGHQMTIKEALDSLFAIHKVNTQRQVLIENVTDSTLIMSDNAYQNIQTLENGLVQHGWHSIDSTLAYTASLEDGEVLEVQMTEKALSMSWNDTWIRPDSRIDTVKIEDGYDSVAVTISALSYDNLKESPSQRSDFHVYLEVYVNNKLLGIFTKTITDITKPTTLLLDLASIGVEEEFTLSSFLYDKIGGEIRPSQYLYKIAIQ